MQTLAYTVLGINIIAIVVLLALPIIYIMREHKCGKNDSGRLMPVLWSLMVYIVVMMTAKLILLFINR